jgi:urea transport system substrate-binding protein
MSEAPILCFSRFRIDTSNQELWRDAEKLEIRRKTFEVLVYLARNPRRLVSRDELLNNLWSDAAGVGDGLLRAYIWELRNLLGDDAKAPRYLETVNRRGYRFLLSVTAAFASTPEAFGAGDETVTVGNPGSHEAAGSLARVEDGEARTPASVGERQPTRLIKSVAPPICVGILHSLTGTMAYSEGPVIDATLLAIDEINRSGGLLGRKVEASVADGRSDAAEFARQAEYLIGQKGARVLFGCWMSAHRKAVLPVVERHDNLLIYPVQYEGLESSPNIFYLGAAPNQQIIPAMRWAFGFLNCRRLFLVGSDYIFPRVAHEIVRDQVKQSGSEIVGECLIPPGSVDVTQVVAEIVRTQPDLIINTINGDSNICFFRSLRTAGITPSRIPTLSFSIGENELRNLDIPGNYAAWNYFQSIDRLENRIFVDSFRSHYGPQRVTSDPMEAAYVGVKLWAQAVRAAGTSETQQLRDALRHQSLNAPEGPMRIDADSQHTWKTIRIGQVSDDGQFKVTYSSENPIRPEPYPNTRSISEWKSFLSAVA